MDQVDGSPEGVCNPKEMAAKRRLVEVLEVVRSELPFVLNKRSTGVRLGAFKTRIELDAFLSTISLASLSIKPSRRKVWSR